MGHLRVVVWPNLIGFCWSRMVLWVCTATWQSTRYQATTRSIWFKKKMPLPKNIFHLLCIIITGIRSLASDLAIKYGLSIR